MKLNKSIANMIVKRTMQIIPNSVNVMDENGIIIASGDPNRLNQRHTGAVVTLRHNQITEIDKNLAKLWNYEAKEGINLPLHYLGSVIGVIGISGEPNQVRPYAQLVKMAAELVMEQSFKLEQQSWQKRYKEEFIKELLKGDLSEEQINTHIGFFQLNISQTISVILIQIAESTAEKLQILLAYLEHHYPTLLSAVIGLNKIVVLKHIESHKHSNRNAIIDLSALSISCKIIIGLPVENISQIYISYQTACYTLDYIEKIKSKKQLIYFNDYKLPALLNEFCHSWQGEMLFKSIEKLYLKDEKHILIKSLSQYFLSNCDLNHASNQLFIHPNTLRYRLDKIENITSLSLNKISDKFLLYLGVLRYWKL